MSARALACETYGPPTERRPRAAQDDNPTVRAAMDMDRVTLVILNRSHSINPPGPPVCHSHSRTPRARARGQLSELARSAPSQGADSRTYPPIHFHLPANSLSRSTSFTIAQVSRSQ